MYSELPTPTTVPVASLPEEESLCPFGPDTQHHRWPARFGADSSVIAPAFTRNPCVAGKQVRQAMQNESESNHRSSPKEKINRVHSI